MRSKAAIELIVRNLLEKNKIKYIDIFVLIKLGRILDVIIKLEPLPEKVEAITIPFYNGKMMILVNRNKIIKRQMFSIAHELGHIVLKHDLSCGDIFFNALNSDDPTIKQMDKEANYFAQELLMPARQVKNFVYNYQMSIEDLCKRFPVSKTAMRKRLEDLGLIDFIKSTPTGNSQKIERGTPDESFPFL
jgi:Zn-dependent peptidase ImmA (M78 family)